MLRATLLLAAIILGACTPDRAIQQAGSLPEGNRVSGLVPGPSGASLRQASSRFDEKNEEIFGEGERLFKQFNCAGCHAGGGGAIGPPLMDDEWTYGSSPSNIFWTIVEGRPQGMPAFGGRIAEDHIWKIVAYVRSLSRLNEDRPAAPPSDGKAEPESAEQATIQHGREVFLHGPCALCHTIRGTRALATVGPDLTHIASRETIAGILPNTRGNLAGWILNPQNLKPGSRMPPTVFETQDLHALLDYLESLK